MKNYVAISRSYGIFGCSHHSCQLPDEWSLMDETGIIVLAACRTHLSDCSHAYLLGGELLAMYRKPSINVTVEMDMSRLLDTTGLTRKMD